MLSNLSLVLSPTLETQALLSRPEEWSGVRDPLEKVRAQAEEEGIHFYAYSPRGREAEPLSPLLQAVRILMAVQSCSSQRKPEKRPTNRPISRLCLGLCRG